MATISTAEPTQQSVPDPHSHQPGVGIGGRALSFLNSGFLLIWGLIATVPLLWGILSSFKTNGQFRTEPLALPDGFEWDNFARAWSEANIGQYFVNSVIVVSMSLTMTMVFSAMAAYVLARYDFVGNKVIYFLFIGGLMFPVFLAIVPLFFVVDNLSGIPGFGLNSHFSLAVVYTAFSLPFTIFFLTAFFRTLPTSVAEAGIMDGCSHFSLFWRVMLPMAKPGLISLAMFNFLGHWNQYILPLVLVNDDDKKVLAQGLASLVAATGFRADQVALFAGVVIAMLPVLIVYMLFQKKVQAGLTAGLLK
jgi:N-acetylglucosamine transport system permease protein